MEYTLDTTTKLSSCFISEDYFPAIVQFSAEELNNRFVEFSYNDTDMFELVGSSKTGTIKQFTLTLCTHFMEMDKPLIAPDAEEGAVILNKNDTIQCEQFLLSIYKDGLHIQLSEKEICKFIKCGQLVFAFDKSDSLVSLYVTGLSTENIFHVLREVHSIENV